MLVSVLASGSKGNSTLIQGKNVNILIDAGMNIEYLETKLNEINLSLKDIKYILLTHTHTDHTSSLSSIIKNFNPTIIMTKLMFADLNNIHDYNNILILFDEMELNSLKVENFKTSHDTSDSRGYIITENDASLVYITDTGYINKRYHDKLGNKNLYIIESNHDLEMLRNGKYPRWLQQRIYSDNGHLSNKKTADYLVNFIGPNTKNIILTHLSEENNKPEIAIETLVNRLNEHNIEFKNIITATQNERTELIEV